MKNLPTGVQIPAGRAWLDGALAVPDAARGIVVIAIVSGGAYAPTSRDAYVASELQTAGVATVLCNLLTRGEDRFLTLRHNIKLLCNRLVAITHWIREHDQLRTLGVAYHATGTGAAAAIRAADRLGTIVRAIVVRSGRPDLAGLVPLEGVTSPSLFIVGGSDDELFAPNRQAYERMKCPRQMLMVPNASYRFDEPGALDQASGQTVAWFLRWLNTDSETAAKREAVSAARGSAAEVGDHETAL